MIRIYFILFLSSLFICCKQKKENTVQVPNNVLDPRKYYEDSIAFNGNTDVKFSLFLKRFYPEVLSSDKIFSHQRFLYATEQELLNTDNLDTSKSIFRVLIRPCFYRTHLISLENKNNRTYLSYYVLNGHGWYSSGTLMCSHTTVLSDSLSKSVFDVLNKIKFETLEEDTPSVGLLDPTLYYFEFVRHGKYASVSRTGPDASTLESSRILAQLASSLSTQSSLSIQTLTY